jgi:hypothetical protein
MVAPLGGVGVGDLGAPTMNIKNIDDTPLESVGTRDLGAPTINEKRQWQAPCEVPELEIQECPPSM